MLSVLMGLCLLAALPALVLLFRLPPDSTSGWRTAALVVLAFNAVGWGLCGAGGAAVAVYLGLSGDGPSRSYALVFGVPGLVGLAVAAGLAWALWRRRRPGPPPG